MKNKCYIKNVAIFLIFITVITISDYKISDAMAGTQEAVNQIVDLYKNNSPEFLKIKNEQELNYSNYLEYKENLAYYQEQINNSRGNTSAIENLKKAYDECLLNVDTYEFYQNNLDKITEENQKKDIYNFLTEYLKCPIFQANIEYEKSIIKELKEELNIIKTKYRKGYAVSVDVKQAKTKLASEEAKLKEIQGQKDILKMNICSELGLTQLNDFSLSQVNVIKNETDYQKEYESSMTLLFLEEQQKAYTIYKDNISKDVTETQIYVDKADENLKLLEAKKTILKNSNLQTISKLKNTYNIIGIQLASKEDELKNIAQKIKSNAVLYRKGKINKIELMKLDVEEKKLEYEKVELLYQQNITFYALEYNILEG